MSILGPLETRPNLSICAVLTPKKNIVHTTENSKASDCFQYSSLRSTSLFVCFFCTKDCLVDVFFHAAEMTYLNSTPSEKSNASVVLPAPSSHSQDGRGIARVVALGALVLSLGSCALRLFPWYALIPVWVVLCELVALAYDKHWANLGCVNKRPCPPEAFLKQDAVFTWQELAQHNAADSAWIAIDGQVYDVTDFIDRHPGGREMLLLAVGRDATNLFHSYHCFSDAPRKILQKYCIGSLATFEHPVYKRDSGFYKEAANAVSAYFRENNIDPKYPLRAIVRMFPVYVVGAIALWYTFCVPNVPSYLRLLGAMILGCCQGLPLTGWMHDASHGSIGHSERWWWAVGRFSLDYISGSSMLAWHNQHVIGHHVYTNVMGADPDLPVLRDGDPRRLVPEQVWRSFYKYQHIYLPPLYGILALKSRFMDVLSVFPTRYNGPIRINPISVQDYLRMATSKAVWFFYRVVVPITFFHVLSHHRFVALFLVTEFITGYWLAFNFQVSHVSDHAEFLFSDISKRESAKCPAVMNEEWAVSQVKTSVDYSHGSPLAAYFSGALNYQSVHHLFPGVSQYLYPQITPIVMDVARKHGLQFNVLPSFMSAFTAHVRHLRQMGLEGRPHELKLE